MRTLGTTALVLLIMMGVSGGFIYSGLYNVSALSKDHRIVEWILTNVRIRSVERQARNIEPPSLEGMEQILAGLASYEAMCTDCHTPIGSRPTPLAQGLNPPAPNLAKAAQYMTAAEMFWVIKNGVKMTGMPAWGPTHKDEILWEITAFLQQLPRLTAQEYEKLAKQAGQRTDKHDHDHGHDH